MDYFEARYYLDGMPLPMFIADKRTGCILYANMRAKAQRIRVGSNMLAIMQDKQGFASLAGLQGTQRRTIDVSIDNAVYRLESVICNGAYRGAACLLITIMSFENVNVLSEDAVIAKICGIYTDESLRKKTHAFLRVAGECNAAFSAIIYEQRKEKYVLKEEWCSRKSVCVPVLRPTIEDDLSQEMLRLKTLKRAADAVCVPYTKQFGAKGVVIYCFDTAVGAQMRGRIQKQVSLFTLLAPDAPDNAHRIRVQKGLDALEQGIAIWDAHTRRLLLANRAYRALFGYTSPRHVSSELGADITHSAAHMHSEEYTDAKGRCYTITHSMSRYGGRKTVTSMMIDMTMHKQAEMKLEAMAKTDALTGIPNRRAGVEHLRKVYAQNKGTRKPLTVCFADIDGLKYINDTYGHGAGDSMICAVADVLKNHVERIGAVCRLGGDEFVMILPGLRRAQALVLAAAIERDAAKCLIGQAQGITMSFGFKEAEYTADETADSLINVADYEMYRQKRRKSAR